MVDRTTQLGRHRACDGRDAGRRHRGTRVRRRPLHRPLCRRRRSRRVLQGHRQPRKDRHEPRRVRNRLRHVFAARQSPTTVDRKVSGLGLLPERGVRQVQRGLDEGQDGLQVVDREQTAFCSRQG